MNSKRHITTHESSSPAAPMFARTLLDIAADVEAAEMDIKFNVLKAAEAGDMNKIIDIMTRWVTEPAIEVLKKQNMP